MDKLKDLANSIHTDVERASASVKYAINPNHRHDDADEKKEDQLRAEIRAGHRFESFVDSREGNHAKWFQDGCSYFWALSEVLDNATETIWILDWWLSPELYLRRPPAQHEDYRLDRVLLRAAQRGVKVMVIVYKEVTQTMSMSSAHTKHFLEGLHENISVMRHPDHLGGEIVLFWSHHEKVVLVDNVVACIGGLDLCFGRWDTHSFPLSDSHMKDLKNTLYPGQDYNNARVADFVEVGHWMSNQQSRLEVARMPWHDIHSQFIGPAVMDVAQHFVERWNFIRNQKYSHDKRYPLLRFPHDDGELNNDSGEHNIVRHPHYSKFKELGTSFKSFMRLPEDGGYVPHGGIGRKGNMRIQVIRSSADWSHGILTEHSIQNAYIQLINEANHFVYIENQFFVSTAYEGNDGAVQNKIAFAIAQRIISAARSEQKFKVIIIIPAVPGFAGDLKESSGTLAIMDATYKAICRGDKSICSVVRNAGYDPLEYLGVYHLRSYDRMTSDPTVLNEMEEKSGLSYDRAQAALARIYMGDNPDQSEQRSNSKLSIKKAQEGESLKPGESKEGDWIVVDVPNTVDEAKDMLRRWESAAPGQEKPVPNSISEDAMQAGKSVVDEPWYGDEESEKNAFVTEELYIHSKLMIVDDRVAIIGSANINDRSQNGDHDSEIAIVVEDEDLVESRMNGNKYMASKFASSLRRSLWKNHLGLAPPERVPPPPGVPYPNDYMKAIGTPLPEPADQQVDDFVSDPLSDELLRRWQDQARLNTEIFDDIFHVTPTDRVKNWDEYKSYVSRPPIKVGHVFAMDMDIRSIKSRLSEIKGHLVKMPMQFLENSDLLELTPEVNPATLEVYL